MQSTINIMNINRVPAKNARRGVTVTYRWCAYSGYRRLTLPEDGNSDMREFPGTLDSGTRRGFGHYLRGITPLSKGCAGVVARSPPNARNLHRSWNPRDF